MDQKEWWPSKVGLLICFCSALIVTVCLSLLSQTLEIASSEPSVGLNKQASHFRFINSRTSLEEIHRRLGKPLSESGSGNLVLHYVLLDTTPVEIVWDGECVMGVFVGNEIIFPELALEGLAR